MITGAEAAYLLTGKTPVRNPSPSVPRPIRDMYRHILYAVKTGRLSTIGGVHKRIDADPAWIGSLTLEEYSAWSQPWERLADVDSVDPETDVKRYRFRLKSTELSRWLESEGCALPFWLAAGDDREPEPRIASHNAFYVAALRLAWAGGNPPKTKAEFNVKLQASRVEGMPSEKTLRIPFDRANEGGEIYYPDNVPPPAKGGIVALFKYAAEQHGKSLKGVAPAQTRCVLADLLRNHGLPLPNDEQWVAIGL